MDGGISRAQRAYDGLTPERVEREQVVGVGRALEVRVCQCCGDTFETAEAWRHWCDRCGELEEQKVEQERKESNAGD